MHSGLITIILAACATVSQALPTADATPDAAAKCSTNTFTNGNFENGSLTPWYSSGDAGYTVGVHQPGRNSHYAAALAAPSPPPGGLPTQMQFVQGFKLCKNKPYMLQFDFRISEVANSGNALSVLAGSSNQVYQFQSFTAANLKYKRVTVPFQSQIGNTQNFVNFQFLNFDDDQVPQLYLDNIKVYKA